MSWRKGAALRDELWIPWNPWRWTRFWPETAGTTWVWIVVDCRFHIESCQNDSKARVLQKASSPSSAKFIEIAHRSGTWSMQKTKLKGARAACFGKLPRCLDDPSGKWVKPHMDWWFVFVAIKSGSWKFGNMISLYVLPVTYPCVQDQLLKKV